MEMKNGNFYIGGLAVSELAEKLGAEVVCTIGHKIVLYRYSNKKGVVHVKF